MTTHPTVEKNLLYRLFDDRHWSLNPLIAKAFKKRIEGDHDPFNDLVDALESAGMADSEKASSVH